MISEAIILAGGLGTRLRSAVPDLPKCLAPVAGRPFLFHLIKYLRLQGINRFVFSLGYKHELIEAYLQDSFSTLEYQLVIEDQPLGTGGAIRSACLAATSGQVLVANGDTLFRVNTEELYQTHIHSGAITTLALKPMRNFERYGVVEINSTGLVTGFSEKKFYPEGLINGGVYLIDRHRFLQLQLPEKFSFETVFLEKQAPLGKLAASVQDGYFIDIGIPGDFQQADRDLRLPPLDLKKIDREWTLFLDRDGVVNVDKPGSYIFTPEQLIFLPGAPELFRKLTERFKYIIITTNQRGIGRDLMSESDFERITDKMNREIEEAGGRIERVYHATAVDYKHWFRKPNPGMAVQAKKDYPDIDFSRSIMVGNNISDMLFGRNTGMYTVFLTTTSPEIRLPHPDIDLIFPLLADFAKTL